MKFQKQHRLTAVTIVILIACIGTYVLVMSHAATPYTSVYVNSGNLVGDTQSGTDTSGTSYVKFGTSSSSTPSSTAPMLGALGPTASYSQLAAAGFKEVVIAVDWSAVEPSEGSYSASTIASVQSEINSALAAGLSPSLDIGVQYAPSWIFSVGGGTQFIDQTGDIFTGSASSGNYVPNAVTDMNVRAQLGDYLAYIGSHLTGLDSVRLGGGAYNEMRYPSGSSGANGDAFWFYDSSSQASLPTSVQGWTPGTGTVAQATTFITAYNNAMVSYGVWLANTGLSDFSSPTKIELLMPGWGERPGEINSTENNLLTSAPDEVHQGLDWTDLLSQIPVTNRLVAYSTYADATAGGDGNPDPAAYIHSILPAGILAGGESTGNGQTTTQGMDLEFQDAQNWNWYVANWFFNGQSQTLQQIDAAFVSQ